MISFLVNKKDEFCRQQNFNFKDIKSPIHPKEPAFKANARSMRTPIITHQCSSSTNVEKPKKQTTNHLIKPDCGKLGHAKVQQIRCFNAI